jgi:hypothetical protein
MGALNKQMDAQYQYRQKDTSTIGPPEADQFGK